MGCCSSSEADEEDGRRGGGEKERGTGAEQERLLQEDSPLPVPINGSLRGDAPLNRPRPSKKTTKKKDRMKPPTTTTTKTPEKKESTTTTTATTTTATSKKKEKEKEKEKGKAQDNNNNDDNNNNNQSDSDWDSDDEKDDESPERRVAPPSKTMTIRTTHPVGAGGGGGSKGSSSSPFSPSVLSPAQMSRKSLTSFVRRSAFSSRAEIMQLFKMVDIDGDGVVTRTELSLMMRHLNLNPTEEDVDALFKQLDINGDEFISFEEFMYGIRWTHNALQLDSVDELVTAKKQHLLLMSQYIQLVARSALTKANEYHKNGNSTAAKAILDVVDLDLVKELQDSVQSGEVLLTERQLELGRRIQQKAQAAS